MRENFEGGVDLEDQIVLKSTKDLGAAPVPGPAPRYTHVTCDMHSESFARAIIGSKVRIGFNF